VERLSEFSGSSKSAARDELMPLLSAMVKDSPNIGDSTDFSLSIQLGFSAEEHASMAGLPLSRRSTKDLLEAYNIELSAYTAMQKTTGSLPVESPPESSDDEASEKKDDPPPGQMKLF
jgi:hypothetical protein